MKNPVLNCDTIAPAVAKLRHWATDEIDEETLQIIDELEGSDNVLSQLSVIRHQLLLTENKHDLWKSDYVRNSKSAMIRLMSAVHDSYDKDPNSEEGKQAISELISRWNELSEDQAREFIQCLSRESETPLLLEFMNQVCLTITSRDVMKVAHYLWRYCWPTQPSPELSAHFAQYLEQA